MGKAPETKESLAVGRVSLSGWLGDRKRRDIEAGEAARADMKNNCVECGECAERQFHAGGHLENERPSGEKDSGFGPEGPKCH